MKLSIRKKDLLRNLTRTHSVADRKSSMPILSNILVSAREPTILTLAATDLYLAVTTSTAAEIQRDGTCAVSARTLFDIVKNLPESEVHLSVDENNAMEIRAAKVRYRIPGMPGGDFPSLPTPGDASFVDIDTDTLDRLITLTHYSMSSDDTRPHLAGTLFEGEGKSVRMVTTDGHRLSKAETTLEREDPLQFSMLVPAKGVTELRRLIDDAPVDRKGGEAAASDVGIALAGGSVFFRRDGVELSIKLADEQFPPYSKVIPQASPSRLTVARVVLTEALRRVSLMASDKSGAVRFNIEPGQVQVTSENPEVGEGSEEIEVGYAGEAVNIGFNARYLLDVLGALSDDEVVLEFGGQLDPGVVRPANEGGFVGVVMPMRI
ncbi:MAG: DNA polymerase III subunit beta [Proteobacteria bacterium]|nr:DNA polymerase III subunit beta [Pseudomonadota bacterium]